jgi:F0F1-type ATP synthase assembly protein I
VSDIGARPTEPKRADQSLGELFKEMSSELGDLFRQEVQLAKVEATSEVKRAGAAAGAIAAGAVAGLLVLVLASFALGELLDQAMNRALAFAIVAAIWAIAAAVLVSMGRKKLADVRGLPETKRSLEEDKEWAKSLKS